MSAGSASQLSRPGGSVSVGGGPLIVTVRVRRLAVLQWYLWAHFFGIVDHGAGHRIDDARNRQSDSRSMAHASGWARPLEPSMP